MAKSHAAGLARAPFIRRLAIVFADPLRLKIVTELYMREMSPTQFYEELGGGSASRVARHFKKLAEYDWLKLVRQETGGRRRGGVEHFYRATELAIFDLETWSSLPDSIKEALSWRTFEQLVERVKEAISAGTFDARFDRHLSWTPVLLDQLGWESVIDAVEAQFSSLFDEQNSAKLRIAQSGEEPILATVAMAAFESPMGLLGRDGWRNHSGLAPRALNLTEIVDPPMPFSVRLAKVFADPLNLKIMTELNMREMSPTQFNDEFGGGSVASLNRRFKRLAGIGWLKMVGEKTGARRRGATEHFYRAIGPAVFDNRSWAEVPDVVKTTFSWRTFEQLAERVKEAMAARTFDAHPERHLSWSLLLLDQLGWERATTGVDSLLETLFEEENRAKARITQSGEEPILATVALAAFESPKDSVKAP